MFRPADKAAAESRQATKTECLTGSTSTSPSSPCLGRTATYAYAGVSRVLTTSICSYVQTATGAALAFSRMDYARGLTAWSAHGIRLLLTLNLLGCGAGAPRGWAGALLIQH